MFSIRAISHAAEKHPGGVATFLTLQALTGFQHHFYPKRIAADHVSPGDLNVLDLRRSDHRLAKALYVDLRVPGGLGGAFV
jgi:hypothetical protein